MSREIYIDGEKIPDERIRDIFRWPPEVPRAFDRSTLLIGSRGAGKTTLFRYLKSMHSGTAIHVPLAAALASFARDSALGPLRMTWSSDQGRLAAKKATSLLAISLLERFLQRGLDVSGDALRDCLPPDVRRHANPPTLDWCRQVRDSLDERTLETFREVPLGRRLPRFVAQVGERSLIKEGPLLLLLDRADMIFPPALTPIVELLDQSSHYVALVATRPGHAGEVFSGRDLGAAAGDHFGIVHVGREPYEPEWRAFIEEAIEAQFRQTTTLRDLSPELKDHILTVSRDSLRAALEVISASRHSTLGNVSAAVSGSLKLVHDSHIAAARSVLRPYHPDYRQLVAEIRKELLRRRPAIDGPVYLDVSDTAPPELWHENTRLNTFIGAALRSGALCMRSGDAWVPGSSVRELEIPPIAAWDKGDPPWSGKSGKPIMIRRSEPALFASGGGGSRKASLFVAYRLEFPASNAFRSRIEAMLVRHPGPIKWTVSDGRVHKGEEWAPVIRSRVKDARLVVGDVTGLRNDVIFELGFAFGTGRPFIPVLESFGTRGMVPDWLRAKQLGSYETDEELLGIISSIVAHASHRSISRPRRPRDPVPGLAIWLDLRKNLPRLREEFCGIGEREGLKVEVLTEDQPEDTIIDLAVRAQVLVGVLTGAKSDGLIHYVCGCIAANRAAGYGDKTLRRRILIVSPEADSPRRDAADSLLRCTDTVLPVTHYGLHEAVREAAREYRGWMKSGS